MDGKTLTDLIEKREPDDAIWKACISLGETIALEFEAVSDKTFRAIAVATHHDTFAAIGTCLLEHLLEHDFSLFDRLEAEVRNGNDKCLYTLRCCRKMGAALAPQNAARWDALDRRFEKRGRAFERTVTKDLSEPSVDCG